MRPQLDLTHLLPLRFYGTVTTDIKLDVDPCPYVWNAVDQFREEFGVEWRGRFMAGL